MACFRPRKSVPFGLEQLLPRVQVHDQGLHLQAPQPLEDLGLGAVAHLHGAQIGQHRDVRGQFFQLELPDQLRMLEENPEGAQAHRQPRGLGGPGQLLVDRQARFRTAGHAGNEQGQAQPVLQEAAGRIYLAGGQLGQGAVQEAQAGEAAVRPLNCEPGGIGADR
jgi:hypothetical protein